MLRASRLQEANPLMGDSQIPQHSKHLVAMSDVILNLSSDNKFNSSRLNLVSL